MNSRIWVLGVGALALAGWVGTGFAEEKKERAYPVADIAQMDGQSAYWIQGELTVTLPAGWTLDEDTGKKDTDIHFEDDKNHKYTQITDADSAEFEKYGAKLAEGLVAAGKDGKEENKAKKQVDGNPGQQSTITVTVGEAKLKYQLTVWAKDGKSYALVSFTAAELYDAAAKDFDAIVSSVKHGKKAAAAGGGGGGDLGGIAGTWLPTTMSVDGKDLPAEATKSIKLIFTGDSYKWDQGGGEGEEGKLKALGEHAPGKGLDWLIGTGGDKGKTQHSVYKVDGDTLTLAASAPGADGFPAEFASKDGVQYVVLKKAK